MSDLLTQSNGDLNLASGNLQVVTDIPTIAAQKLNALFKFFLGEWFADTRLGVPYFRYVLVKNPNLAIVRQVLTAVIESVPEVTGIVSADLQYYSNLRKASCTFVVRTKGGVLLAGGVGVPFIIQGIGGNPV